MQTPRGSGAPAVSGGSAPGSVLSCAQPTWAPDLPDAFLYRAPQSLTYQWSRDGADVAGAASSVYTAFATGEYRCRATASNPAGDTSLTSAPHAVTAASSPGTGTGTGGGGGPAADAARTCLGRKATIVGTPRADTLIGTPGPDVIVARGGDDTIRAGAGDDIVCAGRGDDEVRGGAGADRLAGDRGDDRLRGDRGIDRLTGGRGRDRMRGGSGTDRCRGGAGRDRATRCEL
jgi:Ca2+-binding RTX toxin-like protein